MLITGVTLDLGWKRFAGMLHPSKFARHLDGQMKRANGLVGMRLKGQAKRHIASGSGGYKANRPLTVFIKGSSLPLADDGDLVGSINYHVVSPYHVEIGVMRASPFADIAEIVHEGRTIPVTAKMRSMFFMLWLRSQGHPVPLSGRAKELWNRRPERGWLRLGDTKRAIIIPPRPFMMFVSTDPSVRVWIEKQWLSALKAAFSKAAS